MNDLQLAHLLGHLRAVESAMRMLIDAHPQYEELRTAMREQLQGRRDHGLFSDTPEGAFQGWDEAVQRILGP